MMTSAQFWSGKKVFVTGHTGFKGAWLCLWLHRLGARVTGYALDPPTVPSLFVLTQVEALLERSIIADIRDRESLQRALLGSTPDVVFHMAAQPLVRDSYQIPVETYAVNVMGTVHLLEAVRECSSVRAVVNVTTDKCYENREWVWGYRENEPMGGFDPYSSSKGCSELITAAYRSSFFHPERYREHRVALATARAGNVIGGGDWAVDRLVPDCLRALLAGEAVRLRNPHAIRPWQHVLEPLSGYLLLGQKLFEEGATFSSAWNFGPHDHDAQPVEWIVKRICELWGGGADFKIDQGVHLHEAHYLKLDCSKAAMELAWRPRWRLDQTLASIVRWTKDYREGAEMRSLCFSQIEDFEATLQEGRP